MKKKVLGIALIAMSFVAFGSMAQTAGTSASASQESVTGRKADKRSDRPKVNPYEGLNLTDAQKAQLQQLDAKRQADRQERVKADKTKKEAQKQQLREQRQAARKAYLEQVKAIVGPENYVTFLENQYMNGGNRHGKHFARHSDKGGKNKAGRSDRRRNKADRPQTPSRDTRAAASN